MHIPRLIPLLALVSTCALHAANPSKSFVMKTTEPVLVSNTLLAPGIHTWQLLDSQSNRHVVQISNETTHHVEAVLFAIPKYREVITSTNEVQFWETPVGYARAVRSWFLPGESLGQEFPYSKKAELRIGRLISPIVSVKNQMEPPPLPAVRPRTTRSPVAKSHARTEPVSQQWPEGSWAVITEGPPATASVHPPNKQMKPHDGVWDTLKRLPLTATMAPLIGLIGAGFLLAFFLSGKRKNRQVPSL